MHHVIKIEYSAEAGGWLESLYVKLIFVFLFCHAYIYIYMIDLEDLRLQNSSFHGLTFASKMKTMLDRELPF